MRTFAILPIKSFAHAKQRLRARVPDGPRAGLAQAMVADVLTTLGDVSEIEAVIVVTGDQEAALLAQDAGAEVVIDVEEAGQSAAAALGVTRACELGAKRVLLVPGDCPALDAGELHTLLARTEDIVIVPDRHGTGTNALLLTPPQAIAPAFGPGSRLRHEQAAKATNRRWATTDVPTLAMDADTPEDLAALEASGLLGVCTRAALERLGRPR